MIFNVEVSWILSWTITSESNWESVKSDLVKLKFVTFLLMRLIVCPL